MSAPSPHKCRLALGAFLALCANAEPSFSKSLRLIHSFNQSANLGGGIIADQNGTLYGVLSSGGDCGNAGCVYAISPPAQGGAGWTYSKIYQFRQKADGYDPEGQLTLGPKGELYGTTGYGSGVIYRLAPPSGGSGAWIFTKLGALSDGFTPNPASPLRLSNGALLGISSGGSQTCPYVGCGGVFEVAPNPNGGWSTTTIAAFDGGSLGGSPSGFVGPDSSGGFYVANQYQGRVIYLLPADAMWQATLVAKFPHSSALGCLVMASSGTVYGVAGSFSRGKLFEIQPAAGRLAWTRTTIAKISDHHYAPCPETTAPDGSLIGTVYGDQDFYAGDIFKLSPPAAGNGDWTYTVMTKIGKTGRFGPINAVFGVSGNLYTPVNTAYGPPSAILQYIYH